MAKIHYSEDHFDDARVEWELAFESFRRRGDPRSAARSACSLAELHYSLESPTAAHGWARRGRRVLEGVGECVELGYVELAVVACDLGDIDALEAAARLALDLAERFDDVELEVRALADLGFAMVCQGRIDDGFATLDEALAILTSGRVTDAAVVGRSFCSLLSACDRAGDVRRCEEWVRIVEQQVLIPLGGRPVIMRTHCRVTYGSVLRSVGRWDEAERMITWALGPEGSSTVGHRIEALANLAEIRAHQGRVEEAAAMLAPFEDRLPVAAALARVHLARGEPALAVALADQALGLMIGDVLRRSSLLGIIVEAAVAADDLAAADAAAASLLELASERELTTLHVRALHATGSVELARGDAASAVTTFRRALVLVDDDDPLSGGRLHLASAEAYAALGDRTAAVVNVRSAAAVFERIGATALADRAAALSRQLGVMRASSARPVNDRLADLTARETDVLALLGSGATNAEIAARLYLSPKTIEHHVSRILAKLNVRSRAQAAAVVAVASVADTP